MSEADRFRARRSALPAGPRDDAGALPIGGRLRSTTYKTLAAVPDDGQVTDDPLAPPFATKVAVVVRDDLESWQRLNVTAFLTSGITANNPHLVGAPYADADGQQYLRLFGMPILVFEGSAAALSAVRQRALGRALPLAVYTQEMFATGHDAANRAAVAAVPGDALDLVGLALHGPRNAVDKVLKGTHLHP